MKESIIFHVDVNSAFLSWEAVHQLNLNKDALDLRTIPSVIGGDKNSRHGIVLAKSIPSKQYGIVTAEPISQALKKCPNLVVVPPHFKIYSANSKALMHLLRTYAPVVEQFSIDEAFCDMTGTEMLYGDLVAFAHKIKDEIRDTLGFTVNIGISNNHLLAKMASDFTKPDKVHTLFPDEIEKKMWPLPVRDLLFVGSTTARKLNSLGIYTVGELANCDVTLLTSHLKKAGYTAWQYANGICSDFGFDHTAANRGYSHATTLPNDVTSPTIAKQILLSLCETVCARLRDDEVKGSIVSITIRDCNFNNTSKQISLYSATNVTDEIYMHCCSLFDKLWDGSPIRLLSVSISKATSKNEYQYDLFDNGRHEKLQKLDSAIDKVRARYGEDSIKRAVFLKDSTK